MHKKISGILFLALIAAPAVFTPAAAFAQQTTKSGLVSCNPQIAKDPVTGEITSVTGQCTICDLFKTAKRVFDFAMALAAALATLMIAWGGFLIMTAMGSEARIKQGEDMMLAAAVGLAIALVAWLFIAELMHVLNGRGVIATPWNELSC